MRITVNHSWVCQNEKHIPADEIRYVLNLILINRKYILLSTDIFFWISIKWWNELRLAIIRCKRKEVSSFLKSYFVLLQSAKLSLKMNNDGVKLRSSEIISSKVGNTWYICGTRVKNRLWFEAFLGDTENPILQN